MYDEEYDAEYDWQQYKSLPVVLRIFRRLLLWIQRDGRDFSPSKMRFLDIGCNTGVILEVARGLGFAAQGFEISLGAIEVASNKGFVIASNSLSTDIPTASCEVVYASHVIEHLPDPQELVQQTYRILTPGGYFVLICPNRKGFGPWLRKAEHPLGSRRTLLSLLKKRDCRIPRKKRVSYPHDLYGRWNGGSKQIQSPVLEACGSPWSRRYLVFHCPEGVRSEN
jgi:SAM-dependent methyltransferase